MKRLRVLSVINSLYFGGDQSRLLALAKGIDRTRFDHIVLMLKRPDEALELKYGSLRPEFAAAQIAVVDLGEPAPVAPHGTVARVGRSVPRLLNTLKNLAGFIRERKIDVVDAHVGTANQLGAAAAVVTRRPAVLTTYLLEQFQPLWLSNAAEIAAFTAASAIVTDSNAVADQIRRKVLWPRKIEVIPNGIDTPDSSLTPAEVRGRLGVPSRAGIRVIGQISSFSRRKGHFILLDAARQVIDQEPDVHFLFCGYTRTPELVEKLRTRAAELGILEHVTLAGYPGPIGDVYKAVDIQVHAATAESLPNAIIEGMALGKPAVVAAVAGIPDMVTDGVTGLVVPPSNSRALSDALLRLLRDPELGARMGKAAQEKYLSGYTIRHMTQRLEDLFVEVSHAGSRSSR